MKFHTNSDKLGSLTRPNEDLFKLINLKINFFNQHWVAHNDEDLKKKVDPASICLFLYQKESSK
jgi:hypothetical protein